MNQFKTAFLLTALAGLFLVAGYAVGGRQGATIAFIFALVMNFGAYWFSDKIVLKMYKAREVDETTHPDLVRLVRDLATNANLPMPRVYIIPTMTPNAFATGRDPSHAAVAATEGIMRILSRDELAGVMAHELTHVRNRDTLVQTVAATIAGAIGYIATMARYAMIFGGSSRDDDRGGAGALGALVAILVLPFVAMIIQMAISRSREYMADEGGAMVSGKPLGLASALAKLEQGAQAIPMDAAPATAHMFIVSPLTGGGLMSLFSTHPSTADRIARLQALADQGVGITSARMPRI